MLGAISGSFQSWLSLSPAAVFRVQAPIAFGVHHGKSQPEETSWHMLSGIVIASYGELENADRAKVPFEQGL